MAQFIFMDLARDVNTMFSMFTINQKLLDEYIIFFVNKYLKYKYEFFSIYIPLIYMWFYY